MAESYPLPRNRDGRLLSDGSRQIHVILSDDQTVHSLPLGTRKLAVFPRLCGDWYAEIEGNCHVAAFGATQDEAFLNVLAKAA